MASGISTPSAELIEQVTRVVTQTIVLAEGDGSAGNPKRDYTGIITAPTGVYDINLKSAANYIGGDGLLITSVLDGTRHDADSVKQPSSTSLGTGARTITPTVWGPGLTLIEDATIRFTKGLESYIGTTDAFGQVVSFNLNDGTWTVAITANGLTFSGATLIVNSDDTPSFTMSSNPMSGVLPPLTDLQVHLQAYVFNEYGQPENGITIKVRMVIPSPLSAFFDNKVANFVSAAGIVTITNVFKGASYDIWRGKSALLRFYVPIDAAGPIIEIDPILGNDEVDDCI